MSSRREVSIRIALLQRKTLIETKNRTLKCLNRHFSTVRLMKNVAVLTEARGNNCPQESPSPAICYPRQKNANARGQPASTRKDVASFSRHLKKQSSTASNAITAFDLFLIN